MPPIVESDSTSHPDIQIPLQNIVRFLRQLIHDLRNHLNAAELQSAYLTEITESTESKEEVRRLRSMISEVSADLQRISTALSDIRLDTMPYSASDLLEDLRRKVEAEFPEDGPKVEWSTQTGGVNLTVDPQMLLSALTELFANAFRHHPGGKTISVTAEVEGNRLVLTIREPKKSFESSTDSWGREPLRSIGKGHYGLGLHRSRVIIEAHRGQLEACYDSPASLLLTTVALPLAK